MPELERFVPKIGQRYYHYKHFTENLNNAPYFHCYEIIGIAGDAHNDNYSHKLVIYKPVMEMDFLEKWQITCYARPLAEFLEIVQIQGKEYPRFIPNSLTTVP